MDDLRKRITDEWPASADMADDSVFDHAIGLPPHERSAYLERACGTDEARRRELLSLITAHDMAGTFLQRPAAVRAMDLRHEIDEVLGSVIGNYRIVERIGTGGMGAVYLAERADRAFKRKVALKLIKRGMDTHEILRRFHRERSLLATLDHRNVSRLLDAGAAPDGRPYLVMEHVAGLRIDEYCQEHALTIADRLRLFCETCEAVKHAHQRLIVHRDLKPSNILVTDEQVVKVIDFGIARLLTEGEIDSTATAERFLTPRYACPEQLRGERAGTAADVYALGVILYELLASRHPYAAADGSLPASKAELDASLAAAEPPKPSVAVLRSESGNQVQRRSRQLLGDLDTIALTAIHRDPARRYQSVEQLHEDICRHLAGLPVRARPDTFGYRAGKFIRRNRVAVAVAVAFAVVMVGSAAISSTFWMQAADQRDRATNAEDRATRRFDEVRSLARVMMFDMHDQIEHLTGSTAARVLLVDTALQYLDALAQEAHNDLDLLDELAAGYDRMGRVQGLPTTASLGDPAGGYESFMKAEHILERLLELKAVHEPAEIGRIKHRLFTVRLNAARMLSNLGRDKDSLMLLEQLVPEAHQLVEHDQESRIFHRSAFLVYNFLGNQLLSMGDAEGAAAAYEKMSEAADALHARWPDIEETMRDLRITSSKLSDVYRQLGRHEEAAAVRMQYLDQLRERVEQEPQNGQHLRDLGVTYMNLGHIAQARDDAEEAIGWHEQALTVLLRLVELDPSDATARRTLSIFYENFADAEQLRGEHERALERYLQSYEISVELAEQMPDNISHQLSLAWCGMNVGKQTITLGRPDEALDILERSLDVIEPIAADAAPLAFATTVLAAANEQIARCLLQLGRADEARDYAVAFHEIALLQRDARPDASEMNSALARAAYWLAAVTCELDPPNQVAAWIESANSLLEGLRGTHWRKADETLSNDLKDLIARCSVQRGSASTAPL